MFFPYQVDVPMKRWPWANCIIIAVTAVISLYGSWFDEDGHTLALALWNGSFLDRFEEELPGGRAMFEEELREAFTEEAAEAAPGDSDAEIEAAVDEGVADAMREFESLGFHVYQLITCALVHGGLGHLVGNMIFLWVFGNAVNAKIGNAAYVGLYVFFAVVTGLAWLAFPGGGWYAVGASGAISGVAGMFAVLYPLNDVSIFMWFFYRIHTFELSAVWVLLGYFVIDSLGLLSDLSGVAHISHIAGNLSGLFVAAALLYTAVIRPSRSERTLLEILGARLKRDEPLPAKETIRSRHMVPTPPQMMSDSYSSRPSAAMPSPDDMPPVEMEPLEPTERRGDDDDFLIELAPLSDDEPSPAEDGFPRTISLDEDEDDETTS